MKILCVFSLTVILLCLPLLSHGLKITEDGSEKWGYVEARPSKSKSKIFEDTKLFSAKFLRDKQAENQHLDKWIIMKDLPGEVYTYIHNYIQTNSM